MKLKLLSVDILSIEPLIQDTEIFPNSSEIVNEWVQLIEPTKDSSPLKVCFDGEKYWLFDGYHRLEAMKSLGFNRCDVIINRVDRRDALRRYINDKLKGKNTFAQSKVFKHCMKLMIEDPVWSALEDDELSRLFDRSQCFLKISKSLLQLKTGHGTTSASKVINMELLILGNVTQNLGCRATF
jgi:hypothetical protein